MPDLKRRIEKFQQRCEFLEELKKYLDYTERTEIAKKLGITKQAITNALSGDPNYPKLIAIIYFLLDNKKLSERKAAYFREKINSLYTQKTVKQVEAV